MRIAITAPASAHNIIGGAENLYYSLCNYINNKTPFECEIVSVISPESNFEEIISSYCKFSELNLDHFDCVISLKYPTWMISHKNHICYMQHTLRGLYDTYHLTQLPCEINWEKEGLIDLKNWMESALQRPLQDNSDLKLFFQIMNDVILKKKNSSLLNFPGPFIRKIVHFLDSYALSPVRMKKYFSQSEAVAKRENYFPKGVEVPVLYPATLLEGYQCKNYEYIFTASRLDSPKRIDLIIKAMQYVPEDVNLVIAGKGPERGYLEELAHVDKRIKFVGYLNDQELLDYYANALAIAFVPYDEDYGYITIEAMKSSKPIITTLDSGGPNEFIKNGVNGFSVQPDPKSIAEKITYFAQNVDVARQMGIKAQETVRNINWDNVIGKLLSLPDEIPNKKNHLKLNDFRKKMVVLATFPIYPAMGGGQVRIFNLYRNLAKNYTIEVISLCSPDKYVETRELAPGLTETRVPFSNEFMLYDQNLSRSVNWVPVTDIAAIEGYKLIHELGTLLKNRLARADIAVISHPFLINAVRDTSIDLKIWYEAQDMEYELKKQILPENDASEKLLKMVYEVESYCWKNSEVVFACSDNDIAKMNEIYGPSSAFKMRVPNGVDFNSAVYLDRHQKNILKEKLGLPGKHIVLFMGSWHGPNLEALEHVIRLAESFSETYFFVVGSSGLAVKDRTLPKNIILFGELNDNDKQVVMSVCDLAVNPMLSGSGSNLKMLDYFSYGLPVISTSFGVRGINAEPSRHYIEADINSFHTELCKFFALNDNHLCIQQECRNLVKNHYTWDKIAEVFFANLRDKKVS